MRNGVGIGERGGNHPAIVCRGFFPLIIFFFLNILVSPVVSSNTEGTESLISVATWGTDQDHPEIWEDRIVWAHYYQDSENPESLLSDIYFSNLTTGETFKIPTDLPYQDMPDIYKDLLVWHTVEDDNYEIHLFNLSNGEELRLTNDQVHQIKPKIWGNWIVWQEGLEEESEQGVYLYSLDAGNVTQLGSTSFSAKSPDIWEDRVVWEDSRNGGGNFDIYIYNITTGEEVQITNDTLAQTSPSIWGDQIVWMDYRDTPSQIYLYNLVTENESFLTSGDFNRGNPVISGNYVVYINDTVVTLMDLFLNVESPLSTDTTRSIKYNPDIFGYRVVWSDMRNGDFDIYLYTLGISMSPLIANFTADVTQGESPLNVSFFDTSSGQVDGWQWDFGDGMTSTEQNPSHTYELDGSYTVVLTVHNPRQRDAVKKSDLISVGSEPVPAFTQNKTSGPAPLVIQFNDESAGLPTGWTWDFGDGSTAIDQSPVHLYAYPGIYSVSLDVSNTFGNASLNKPELITVMDGSLFNCTLPSDGINLTSEGNITRLSLNITEAVNCSIDIQANQTVLLYVPETNSRILQVQFFAENGSKFDFDGNDAVTGIFGEVFVQSCELNPHNLTQMIGNNSFYNFTLSMTNYSPGSIIHSVAWEGCTPDDLNRFDNVALPYNVIIDNIAATVQFTEDIQSEGSATLTFGVSSDWVEQYGWRWSHFLDANPSGAEVYVDGEYVGFTPLYIGDGLSPGNHTITMKKSGYYDNISYIKLDDKRDSIHVIRIGDDGSGEVLNTTFIGHDPVRNLDFFRAESPNGLSTFGLASLSKSGNIFQLIQLIAIRMVGQSTSHSDIIRSHSTSEIKNTQVITSVPTPGQTPPGTETESPGHFRPLPTASPTVKKEPGEPAPLPTSEGQGTPSPSPPQWLPQTLKILENLSIIFVVIFVTVLFYLRWRRKEE